MVKTRRSCTEPPPGLTDRFGVPRAFGMHKRRPLCTVMAGMAIMAIILSTIVTRLAVRQYALLDRIALLSVAASWLLVVACGVYAMWLWYTIRRRVRRLVIESNYELCLNCGYRLTGITNTPTATVTCPECGAKQELSQMHAVWERWYPRHRTRRSSSGNDETIHTKEE